MAAPLFAAVMLLATAASALAAVHYVDVNSTNAMPPYTNWTTAATNISLPHFSQNNLPLWGPNLAFLVSGWAVTHTRENEQLRQQTERT